MKQDDRIVLTFLSKIDERVGKIRKLPNTGRPIREIYPFLNQITAAVESIRKQIQSGLPYGAQFIHLFCLNEQMQWNFFMYYKPSIIDDSVRWTLTPQQQGRKGPMARNEKNQLRRDYSRHLAEMFAGEKKIEYVAGQIKSIWENHFDEKFPKELLSGKAPSESTIRRDIEKLFPDLLRVKRPRLTATISLRPILPTWEDAAAFCDAQSIKPMDPYK